MGLVLRHRHGPSRRSSAPEWSTLGQRRFPNAVVEKDLLSGFERPSRWLQARSLNFPLVRGALERERAYSSAG